MPKTSSKTVLGVMEDLLFTVKINDIAKRLGLQPQFVKSEADALAAAKEQPLLIILDLNSNAVQPIKLLEELKKDPETKQVSVIGFVSHVQAELKQQAQQAGCDMVLARSAFTTNLPTLLKRHAGITV